MGTVQRPQPAADARVAVVVAQFNEPLTAQLLDGALSVLAQHNGDADVYWVPGAFEIPQAAAWLIGGGEGSSGLADEGVRPTYDGILTLGCLIKGDTDHYFVLAAEVTRRLGALSVSSAIPLSFGVLTCQTVEQAALRADPARDNKGGEVMTALLEMISLRRSVGPEASP